MPDLPPAVPHLVLALVGLACIVIMILIAGIRGAPPDLPPHWIAPGLDPAQEIQRHAPRG